MISNGILLLSLISVLSSHHQRLPVPAYRNKYRNPQTDITQRDNLNETSPSNPSPQRSGNPNEEEDEILL